MRHSRCAIALVIVLCSACRSAAPQPPVEGGRYGKVKVRMPSRQARGIVIFFSDRNGLTAADDAAAEALANAGALVAEVDTPGYLRELDTLTESCHQPAFDAEWFSRQIQRERSFPNYLTPILVGVGEGATLAAMSLAYAPAATIAGVVSINPSATVAGVHPICSTANIERRGDGFHYDAPKNLPGVWMVALTHDASNESRDYVTVLQHQGAQFEIHEVAANQSIGEAPRVLIEPHLAREQKHVTDISTLPLTVLGVDHPSNLMAIVISGDGGWRDLDKTIAENLHEQGMPIVGWDSLRYFWTKKTAQQTADDLAVVMRTFMDKWHANDVALIGYSFGADVMPFAYNRLPADLRSHVVLMALLGFSKTTDFQITVSGWLGEPPGPDAVPVLPEADQIPPTLMQCFYGQGEDDSACPALARRGVEVIRTSGGHHFDGDYAALARDIMVRLKQSANRQSARR
jgi:type IV secretory pathway VirJ component